jgi:hypothetical protein
MEIIQPSPHLVQDTKQFHLSTRGDAGAVLNGDMKSQILFNIPDAIVLDDSIEYIQFSIPYAVVPNSFYIINMTNCHLIIELGGITTTYMFPMGNYTASTFITQFKALLPTQFNITLGQNNNQFTITHTTTDFTILGTSTIDSVMGFSGNLTSIGFSVTMPRVCNFLPLPRICFRCSKLANSFTPSSIDSGDVILSIPNTAKLNGQIIYTNNTSSQNLFKLDKLSDFVVSITNDDGDLIDFNGISSFWVFQFNIFRKSIEKPMSFKNIISLVNSKVADL